MAKSNQTNNWLDNYNDSEVHVPKGFHGDGYTSIGNNFNPAWGGQFQNGGYAKLHPPIYLTDKNDDRIGYYNKAGNQYLYKPVQKPTINPIKNNLHPSGLIHSDNNSIEADVDIHNRARIPKYYDINDKVNQNFGGRETQYKYYPENGDIPDIAPSPYNTRTAVSHYQMGGSIPGAVGFTYARTQGAAPSNGKYAKKTKASAQNGKEMQYYQEGLDFQPKTISQNGSWLDKFQEEHPSVESLKKTKLQPKGKEIKISQKDATSNIKPETSKPLTSKQIEQRRLQELQQRQGDVHSYTPQSTSSRISEIALNPLTAFGYAARNENLPEHFSKGERNSLDMATDIINPAYYLNQANEAGNNVGSSISNIAQGNLPAAYKDIKNAGMNTLNALPLASEYESLGRFANEAGQLSKQGLREGVDLFHPVGKALAQIEKEGIAAGLSAQEIKKLQLEKVGITSAQRKGYFPGVSEVVSEYITPYSYDNAQKRILDIPRRIIKGETNSKNLSNLDHNFVFDFEAKNLVSKPRYDAWRMYSGLPQENNTFRMAETSPINHPSYSTEQLNNLEKFSLNDEDKLLRDLPQNTDLAHLEYGEPEDLIDALPNLQTKLQEIQNIKNKGIDTANDFLETNIMGGYNRRFFDNKMEYNDIWDLDLKGNKVEKYFGKPFLSHGQLDYSFQPAEDQINKLIKQGEYYQKNISNYKKPKIDYFDNGNWNNHLNQINQKDLILNKKQKDGGIIKDDRGQWGEHKGEPTRINQSNPESYIDMGPDPLTGEPLTEPLLGISDKGEKKMMYPGEKHKYKKGTKYVDEFPMAKNGLRQEQKGLQNLDNLVNFTNYNTKQPGGWLNKYN